MPRFKERNFQQHMLVPVDLSKQLMKGTMEYTINEVINRMDMSKFYERYKNDAAGAPAFDPRVLLKLVLFAYSRGILSSRRIEEAAANHITFIALSGYNVPDFTTIANFISSMKDEISVVFLHVLRVCEKMNLVGGERFAIDGHKVSSYAAHGVIQGYNGIAVADAKHQVVVAASAYGTAHEGPQLKNMLDLTKQNLSDLKTDKTDNPLVDKQILLDANYFSEANLKVLADEQIDAYVPDPMFRKRDPRFADATEHKRKSNKNVYDTSRNLNKRGFGQEDFKYDKDGDFYLCKAGHRLNRWGSHEKSGGHTYGIEKIAHCRDCPLRSQCIPGANIRSKKMITVANIDKSSRRLPYSTKMKAKIDTPEGKKVYSDRMRIIEPVFSNIRAQKGMEKFTLRTRVKVNIQWQLYMIVHNLSKIAMIERRSLG